MARVEVRGTDGAGGGRAEQPLSEVCVREMAEADIDAVSAVRVRGWQAAYPGLMPQAYLDAMDVAQDAARRREWFARRRPEVWELVAGRAGRVVGWLAAGPARDADLTRGAGSPTDGELAPEDREFPAGRRPAAELLALYVTPELLGTGVGRALLDAGTLRARSLGYGALYLWVVRGNTRAQRFYERAGFAPDGAEAASDVGGRRVPELRYRRPLR
ncbi:N-acetyltransferase family protein [Streptomyces noursei]|uniref:GNAT family N-acetyltransferase n=1 Tax=Streptomyces noursei TaxID=1971 RepID=UPI0039B05B09